MESELDYSDNRKDSRGNRLTSWLGLGKIGTLGLRSAVKRVVQWNKKKTPTFKSFQKKNKNKEEPLEAAGTVAPTLECEQ